MTIYTAPVKDYLFLLNDVVGYEEVIALNKFADATPDLVQAILEEAGKYMGEVITPLNQPGDREKAKWSPEGVRTPKGYKEAYQGFTDAGWMSVVGDPEFGGQGLPQTLYAPIYEMVCSASLAFAQSPGLTIGAFEALQKHGSEDLKKIYIPKLVSGEWQGTMNLTESHAGSDVGALRTKATVQEDGSYKIKGQKIFITCGEHDMTENIIHLVLARIEGAPEGSAGISLFLVPKFHVNDNSSLGERNDVHCASIEHKLGLHGSPTCVMVYGENDNCVGYLIGQENQGLACMFSMMNAVRLIVGLQGIGCAERAYQQALRYASERVQGVPVGSKNGQRDRIINHADIRRTLMTMKAKIAASRAIALWNAKALDMASASPSDQSRSHYEALGDLLTPLSKAYGTDVGVEVASEAIQVHGGMGFIEETGIAQIYRDVRITPIYEGTNGIQAWDLANRKLKINGGSNWQGLLKVIDEFANDRLSKGELKSMQAPIISAVDACRDVGSWFLEQHSENARNVAAGSVPFLRLLSETIGTYLLAKGADKAVERINNGDPDTKFLESQIVVAKFMAERILPPSTAQLDPIKTGDELLFALTEQQLGLNS